MPVLRKFCCCCTLKTGGVVFGWLGLVGSIFNIASTSTLLANMKVFGEYSGKYAMESGLSVDLASSVVFVISYALLIFGTIKENRYMLLPWLISGMIGIIALALVVIILGPLLLASQKLVFYGTLVVCIGIPLCALDIYLWLCIYSLYQHLRDMQVSGCTAIEAPRSVNDLVQGYDPPSYEKLNSYPNV